MRDIRQLIVALKTDVVLQPLLGSTSDDPRIYWYYQPDAIVNTTTKRAYITYAHTATPRRGGVATEPVYTLAVWGVNSTIVDAVRDRLVALFDQEFRTSPTGRVCYGELLGEHDSYQENTKFAGKNLQVRLGFSNV